MGHAGHFPMDFPTAEPRPSHGTGHEELPGTSTGGHQDLVVLQVFHMICLAISASMVHGEKWNVYVYSKHGFSGLCIIPSVLENFILAIVTIILVNDGHDMA